MQTIYKEIIISKTGIQIPKLLNGKTLESAYNPEADAERKIISFSSNTNIENSIFLIYGLGSGIFIKKLLEKYPDCKIICVEFSTEDIDFLSQIPAVQEIKSKISLTTKENLYSVLLKEYIPSFYGNLNIVEQNNYFSNLNEYEKEVKAETQRAMKDISHDYSVQAHFGKIWQHNILNNMKQNIKTDALLPDEKTVKNKTCVILAAGPSLEDYLKELSQNREKYYILATDTGYSAAISNKLKCDAVITIDAQNVSVTHFIHKHNKETLFLTDLSSSPSLVKTLQNRNCNPRFFGSGHPLFISACKEKSINNYINAGSGTVTIAALDFAIKTGFSKIHIAGADFSFPKNKAYAKGTYLDYLYNRNSRKTASTEKEYCRLMFRTDLSRNENNIPTTEILLSYRKSLENYLDNLKETDNISWKKEQNVYVISKNYENINKDFLNWKPEGFSFIKEFLDSKENTPEMYSPCLPYIAYLRRKYPNKEFHELSKMAKNDIRRFCNL